jgi:hypothetical protein
MKLTQLAAKPQLIKIELDDEEVVAEFGEVLEFYTWDRQPLDTFMKLANVNNGSPSDMIEIVKNLILDEDGKEIITSSQTLPSSILIKAIAKIVDKLGK